MKKKILAILATLSLAVAFALPAFAASGISPQEQALLDRFMAGVTLKDGTVVKPGPKYIAAAKAALKVKDMDASDIAKVTATMNSVEAEVIAGDYHALGNIYEAKEYSSIVAEITATANELGFKVTAGTNGTGGNPVPTVYYKDPDVADAPLIPVYGVGGATNGGTTNGGSTNKGGNGSVKQTGFDMTATVVTVIALVVVLSGSAVVIGKKNLLAD